MARLSITERLSRWRSLLLKINLVFQMIATQSKTKMLLGEAVFDSMFPATQAKTASLQHIQYHILKGQVVGKSLPPGEGPKDQKKAHMDPAMCGHQEADMVSRGNKISQWWTCKKCLSRWARPPMTDLAPEDGAPQDQDLVIFGKYRDDPGRTQSTAIG